MLLLFQLNVTLRPSSISRLILLFEMLSIRNEIFRVYYENVMKINEYISKRLRCYCLTFTRIGIHIIHCHSEDTLSNSCVLIG